MVTIIQKVLEKGRDIFTGTSSTISASDIEKLQERAIAEGERIQAGGGEIPIGSVEKIRRERGGISGVSTKELAERQAEFKRRQDIIQAQQQAEQDRLAQQQAEQEADRQERIQSGRISGQIQQFDPLKSALPLPSRKELGADEGFFRELGGDIASRFRRFINIETAEDLERRVRGEKGIPVVGGLGATLTTQIPTGTIIDTDSGIRPEITIRERVEQEAIIGGGAGTPAEFIAQDIGAKVSTDTQRRLDSRALIIQRDIDAGKITLAQGEAELQKQRIELEKQAQKEFEGRLKKNPKLSAKLKSEASIRQLRQSQQLDVITPAITGGIIGGLVIGGTPAILGGAGLQILGGQQFITGSGLALGGKDLTISQRLLEGGRAGVGLLQVGIGGRALFGGIETQIDKLTIQDIQKADEFLLGRELVRTPEGSLFRIKTIKQTPLGSIVTEQRVPIFKGGADPIFGTTETGTRALLKAEERFFSVTGGKGVARLDFFSVKTGDIVSKRLDFALFGRGFPSPTAPSLETQGLKFDLKDFQASFGRGGIIVDREITTFPFGAIGREKRGILQIVTGDITKGRIGIDTTALFKPTTTGFISRADLLGGDTGVKIFTGGGAKTSSLAQFFQQQQVTGFGLASQSAKETTKILTQNLASTKNIIGGLGAGATTLLKIDVKQKDLGLPTTKQILSPQIKLKEQVGLGLIGVSGLQEQETRRLPKVILGSGLLSGLSQGLEQSLGLAQPQRLRQKLVQEQLSQLSFFPTAPSLTFDFGDVTPTGRGFFFPPFALFPSEKKGRKRRRTGRFPRTRLAPSLTGISRAQFGGIFAPLPKELFKGIGILPGQIRFQPSTLGIQQPRKRRKKVIKKSKKIIRRRKKKK